MLPRCSAARDSEIAIFHGLASSCVPGMDAKLFVFMLVRNCAAVSSLACLGFSGAPGPCCGCAVVAVAVAVAFDLLF